MKNFVSPARRDAAAAALAAALFFLMATPWARADLNHDQIVEAKAATALLVVPDGSGTAFCISDTGLFVTCNHVVEGVKKDALTIVVSPAGKDEKRFPATVIRTMKDQDLAIVKVALDRKVPVLKLGDVADLAETDQVYAFGYPFGKMLATDEKSYPSISVNVGRITSLRKKKDQLDTIQFDAQVNPGNSGGPVLDGKGEVVGIVASGVIASGINFAIPVSILTEKMKAPVITVKAAPPDMQHPSRTREVTVSVDWVFPPPEDPKVTVEVHTEGPPRKLDAQKGKDGTFHAEISPPEESSKTAKLQIALEFDTGRIAGTTEDRDITIGGKRTALHDIKELKKAADGGDFLADGAPAGALPELQALPVEVAGTTMTLDARKASRIEIQAPSKEAPPMFLKAVVRLADGREFSEGEMLLGLPSVASSYPTTFTPPASLTPSTGSKPSDPRSPNSPNAPANPHPAVALPSTIPIPVIQGKVDLPSLREISLPGPISDVVAAEDGRVLLFNLQSIKKVAVFDVIDLAFRGYINLDDGDAVIAGGSRYLLAVCPGENVIRRYSLRTLLKERTTANSFGKVSSLTMGRSSPRLAMMIAGGTSPGSFKVFAYDAESMTAVATAESNIAARMYSPDVTVRASADGQTFAVCQMMLSPSGFNLLTFRDTEFKQFYEHSSCGILVPNADGSEIYTSASGIFTDKYATVIQGSGNWATGVTFLPSYHPMYFISLPYNHLPGNKAPKTMGIYLQGSTQALLQMSEEFPEMHIARETPGRNNDPLTTDKRYHFYPQLNLLLTIPPTNNKIVARPLDVRAMMDKKGIDYLYVVSSAPVGKVSAAYYYKLDVASNASKVECTLQSGPKGLTVSKTGEVVWNAPAEPADEMVSVSLKGGSGQEMVHTFCVITTQ